MLLYCGKSCNNEFSYDQIKFRHHRWPYLDSLLQSAIIILHQHERREEDDTELYCGLKGVRLENIKEIKAGFFISHVSTSDDIEVAEMYRSDQGCILHFHPSMRRAFYIKSCDVSWISPFKHEREILFSRSHVGCTVSDSELKEFCVWNAKVENEDEHTQMILLTWAIYDQYMQRVMQISTMWNHKIDLNLIYVLFDSFDTSDVNMITKVLREFEEWKLKDNNKEKYKERKNEFVNNRCCNHDVNLLCVFLFENKILQTLTDIELATLDTAHCGLPFVDNDKKIIFCENKIIVKSCFSCYQSFLIIEFVLECSNKKKLCIIKTDLEDDRNILERLPHLTHSKKKTKAVKFYCCCKNDATPKHE
ncbi:hypothetical protein RFI_38691 [Reticulomyxa filosa]|uniref:6-Cys domain-containing protein n=1 Tax=Reticulomyxa filosa TaxID=46433 RepID=X6LCE5_RETFI|nr:hypothetical protein RFI_38691 [Reticulomyxa filosa]|eukprot:ETN98796.1 hypothetical protein RFI_38691 [Reticulomyxa filosa]